MSTLTQLYRKYGNPKLAIDYLKARDLAAADISTKGGWASLSDDDKYMAIRFFLDDPTVGDRSANDTAKVAFLIGKGLSLTEAQTYLVDAYSTHHTKEVESCRKRAESEEITSLVATYLELSDAADFTDTTKTMIQMYKERGIKGTNYGTVGEGLMDFIESTVGTTFETMGLAQQGYIVKVGTITDLINGLVDILINGNYTR